MRSLVILLDAANSSDIECSEKLHTTECERSYSKRKSLFLFQLDYIQLQSVVSSVISWKYIIQAVPSKKKKNLRKKRGKENEMKISGRRAERWKRGEEENEVEKRRRRKKRWKEFVRKRENKMWKKRRKKKGENEMWKKKK